MKRLVMALMLACAVFMAPGISSAYNGFYLTPKFLMTVQNTGTVERSGGLSGFGLDEYSQFTLGGALAGGYDFWPNYMIPFRAELEVALRGNSEAKETGINGSSELTTNSTTLLLNGYYDFHNSTAFTPYVGAGIGFAFNYLGVDIKHNGQSDSADDRSTNFAWQVGAGVAYALTEDMSIDAAYRYLDLGYTEVSSSGQSVGIRPYNHEVTLGLRFGF
ncbi:MAG: porin family protein [Desulfovibrionaceae bacterium]|nr:porin family protein [Desulfovibrionaceae bacterium]